MSTFQDLVEASVLLPRRDAPLEEFEVLQEHDFVTINLKQAGGLFDVRADGAKAFRLDEGEV